MAAEGEAMPLVALPPQVVPLEAAPVVLARLRALFFQQLQGAADMSLAPGLVGQVHARRVQVPAGGFLLLLGVLGLGAGDPLLLARGRRVVLGPLFLLLGLGQRR